jgi:di/tricarboxylate transporter
MPFGPDGLLAIACVLGTLTLVARGRVPTDLAMAAGVAALVLTGVLEPAEAFRGLSSPSILTIALLLVVSQGVIGTGLVQWLAPILFGSARTTAAAQARLMLPSAAISGFINNTPLVAMAIPVVEEFSRRTRIPPGKLFLPLAYAASLGGLCTLIGTSTNLVVDELWTSGGHEPFRLFDLLPYGGPAALAGIGFILVASPWLLPARGREALASSDPRTYAVEMLVTGAPVAGSTVEGASLRGLEGLFLSSLVRGDETIAPVEPSTRLLEGDRLFFVGDVRSVVSLQRMRGLGSPDGQAAKLGRDVTRRFLVEAVVSDTSPLLGRTIRESRFRNAYGAVVIAVSRNGARIENVKVGSIRVREGDVLLLETGEAFMEAHAGSRDFLLVRRIEDSSPVRFARAPVAAAILAGVVLVATLRPFGFGMFHASLAGAALMVATRCCTGVEARKALNARLLFVIAGALALGAALAKTGVAEALAAGMVRLSDGRPLATLAVLYATTFVLTELLTNATAAALVFPVAMSAAPAAGLDPRQAALVVMIGASASFATPIGYQTNLMVQQPGGYRFADYLRLGLPLAFVVGVVSVACIHLLAP